MKGTINIFCLILVFLFTKTSYGQGITAAFPTANKTKTYSLSVLKDSIIGGKSGIRIVDIQNSGSTYLDLSNQISVRLYTTFLDVSKPPLFQSSELEISLKVFGTNANTSTKEVYVDTFKLSISELKDFSSKEFVFHKENTPSHAFYELDSVLVEFDSQQFSNFDSSNFSNILLQLHIGQNRYFLDPVDTIAINIAQANELDSNVTISTNELIAYWNHAPMPSSYEIEIVHIAHQSPSNSDLIDVDFRNANRIHTDNSYLPISKLYTPGFLVLRSRVKRPQIDKSNTSIIDKSYYTKWSMPEYNNDYSANNSNVIIISSDTTLYSNRLPWQLSSSRINGGKRVEYITYFDGLNKSRQNTVIANDEDGNTKVNSNLTIDYITKVEINETYYDFNGEAILSILPTPIIDEIKLDFQEGLNLSNNLKIDKIKYDSLESYTPPVFQDTSIGASNYYSSFNSSLNIDSIIKRIPDANKFPYSLKEYHLDGTNRLKVEYGMGSQLANDVTKNTQYAYAKPTQSELNYLFGSNVGLKEYYKKNIVIDPNGVMQVNYVDNQNRTIATGIDGIAEGRSNLSTIQFDTINFVENLVEGGSDIFNSNALCYELNFPLFVSTASAYRFNYSIDLNDFDACDNSNFCFDCSYELQIQIIDDKNELILEAKDSLIKPLRDCNQFAYNLDTITYKKNQGDTIVNNELVVQLSALKTYTVVKKLCYLNSKEDLYSKQYVDSLNCGLLELEFFINKELDRSDLESCEILYENPRGDPCIKIKNRLRGDFLYPDGVFTTDAMPSDSIAPYIYRKLYRVSGCHELDTISLQEFSLHFSSVFKIKEGLQFAEFESRFADFFMLYHPTYCQLELCYEYNDSASMQFDDILYKSKSISELKKSLLQIELISLEDSLKRNDDTLIYLLLSHKGVADSTKYPLLKIDPILSKVIDSGLLSKYYSYVFNLDTNFYYENEFFPKKRVENVDSVGIYFYDDSTRLANYIVGYFDNLVGYNHPNFAGSYGINELLKSDSILESQKWELYKQLYLSSKENLIDDILKSVVCFTPKYDYTGEEPQIVVDSSFYCDLDSGIYYLPWVSEAARLDYLSYSHFIGYTNLKSGLLESQSAKDFGDSIKNVFNSNFLANQLYMLLKSDSILNVDSVTFVSLIKDSVLVICNPYKYLDTLSGGNLFNRSLYTVNLSSLISEYKIYFRDTTSNPLFDCEPYYRETYNCEDFYHFHSVFVDEFSSDISINVPQIENDSFLSIGNVAQKIYANWMNFQTGMNLSFRDYYMFASNCHNFDSLSIFGNQISIPADSQSILIKNAFLSLDSVFLKELDEHLIFDSLNANLIDTINREFDILQFGENDLAGSENDLYYIKEGRTKIGKTIDTVRTLFEFLYLEDSTSLKFDSTYGVLHASRFDIEQYKGVKFSGRSTANSKFIFDRAYQFSNGNIWIRLLNKNDSSFYKHYTFYYTAFNDNYKIIDLARRCINNYNSSSIFNETSPIITENQVKYLRSPLVHFDDELIVSSSELFGDASFVVKTALSDPTSKGIYPYDESCEEQKYIAANDLAEEKYNKYLDSLGNSFVENYRSFCLNQKTDKAFSNQVFNMNYGSTERQFTLYYYDQAGNLVQTIPPEGFDSAFPYVEDSLEAEINDYRNSEDATQVLPSHKRATNYEYNSQNQVIKQNTPNGGLTHFWYDQYSRLRLSQNAKQEPLNNFSYTIYDKISRIRENGEVQLNELSGKTWEEVHAILILGILDSTEINWDEFILSKKRFEVTKTFYDTIVLAKNSLDNFEQVNLRSRVSTSAYYKSQDSSSSITNWEFAIHYSYDPTGNVKSLVNDFYQNGSITRIHDRFKKIDYLFDVTNGNVLQVLFQLGQEDMFVHKYDYDGQNRISNVFTSQNGIIWDKDASYKYFRNGPLARVELGEHSVQGIDYSYTLNGNLKAVNGSHHLMDLGNDDEKNTVFAQDAFGYELNYYQNDYKSIGDLNNELIGMNNPIDQAQLFNGNISSISHHNSTNTIGKEFNYDQLNRIKSMNEKEVKIDSSKWGSDLDNGYTTFYDYDKSGNLTELHRYDGDEDKFMDYLDYNYEINTDKLLSVDDSIPNSSFLQDIDQQVTNNYQYDEIGNLIADSSENICQILWYPNGKIKRIRRDKPNRERPDLYFEYDPNGNRIKKTIHFVDSGKSFVRSNYYVRDAQGNILANYQERDCELYEGEDSLGEYFYQYSESYLYYSTLAVNQSSQDLFINFIDQDFSLKEELKYEAYLSLGQIPNIKDSIFLCLDDSIYFELYPDAKCRVIQFDPFAYSKYLYDNHFSSYASLINDRNEVWLHYLIESDSINIFLDSLDANYESVNNKADHVSDFFSMNKILIADSISANSTLVESLLNINSTELNSIELLINDQNAAASALNDLLNDLQVAISNSNYTNVADYLRLINAHILILDFNGVVSDAIDGIDIEDFYPSLNSLPSSSKNMLNAFLHHLYILDGSSVELDSLNQYMPSIAIDWSNNNGGKLLAYFLYKNIATSNVWSTFNSFFVDSYFKQFDIFYNNSNECLPYLNGALNRNCNNVLFENALKGLATKTDSSLYLTEDIAHLGNYYRLYCPIAMLQQCFIYDSLYSAFLGLSHFTPYDYARELASDFSINVGPLSGCNPHIIYLVAENYNIYGSNRLGTMDAKKKRKVGDNQFERELGAKQYELTNHLGNVVATVSDKKIHPLELQINGTQDFDTTLGYQADISGRYDYYPFGMEIKERSGDFSLVDYTQDVTTLVYDGMLNSCNLYSTDPSGNTNKTCSEELNYYGQSYVSNFIRVGYWNGSGYVPNGHDSLKLKVDLNLSSVISNIDTSATYRMVLYVDQCRHRVIEGRIHHGGGTEVVEAPEALNLDDKYLTLEFKGGEWESFADSNGDIDLEIAYGKGNSAGFIYKTMFLRNIKVYKIDKNTSVPLAKRDNKAYPYGFQGQERDDEVKGSGNSLSYKYRIHDTRLGRFLSIDPLSAKYPFYSPYSFSGNRVIDAVELEGLEPELAAERFLNVRRGKMARGEKVTKDEILMTVGVAAAGYLGVVAATAGPAAATGIVLNEVKDEALSRATGGASDVFDASKVFRNLLEKGLKKQAKDPGLGNQFKDKSVDQVNEAMERHVKTGKLEKKYEDPVSGSKSYQNTQSGNSYNVDTGKSGKTGEKVEPAHIDVNYPKPKPKNISKKKLPIKDE